MDIFVVHENDNVGVALTDIGPGTATAHGAVPAHSVEVLSAVALGHKVALRTIALDEPVIKYGVRIGHACSPIEQGEWVHLHNMASDLDERSGTLDVTSGVPTDTTYE